MSDQKLPRFITFAQLREVYGIPRTTAYRYMREQGMPAPYQMGANSVRFNRDELEEWFTSRPHASIHCANTGKAA